MTATLAGRPVPTATATTFVHGSRYLDLLVERNRAELRAEAAERRCHLLERDLDALAGRFVPVGVAR